MMTIMQTFVRHTMSAVKASLSRLQLLQSTIQQDRLITTSVRQGNFHTKRSKSFVNYKTHHQLNYHSDTHEICPLCITFHIYRVYTYTNIHCHMFTVLPKINSRTFQDPKSTFQDHVIVPSNV